MKVAIVSDLAAQGGAAIACNRLATALAGHGAEVRRYSFDHGSRPRLQDVEFAPQLFGRRAAGLVDVFSAFGIDSVAQALRSWDARRGLSAALTAWAPDIINLHNLHGFAADFHTAEDLVRIAPMVWTLHDMWSFTGRCSYAFACRRFEAGCTAECPTPDEYPALDRQRIAASWEKRAVFLREHRNVAAVTPSEWLAEEARRGLWRDHRIEVIPNSLDLAIYSPVDPTLARTALGLPQRDRQTFLFAAEYLIERRKGGPLAAAALLACRQEIEVWTLGHGDFGPLPPNIRSRSLGYIADERTKALVYSAADYLVHPAPIDNFPNTIAECLACGTPVIAFKTGGIPEMLSAPECGLLVDPIEAEALSKAINEAAAQPASSLDRRQSVRAAVAPLLEPGTQAAAYLALFRKLTPSK
jgi:glycosyltransferase involved in cell wall biosynthesis